MICTWEGCTEEAVHIERAVDGERWAELCDPHHRALEEATTTLGNPARMLASWIEAQGGSRKAASRLAPIVASGLKRLAALVRK